MKAVTNGLWSGIKLLSRRHRARLARERAILAVQDAEARNDTRDLGRARMRLQEAQHAALRAGA